MTHAINNDIYNELGERWYNAFDDPVALLRAESRLIAPWIIDIAQKTLKKEHISAIDLGCGGGFISNQLALSGINTTAFDLSLESLAIAKKYDQTKSVDYRQGDVTNLLAANNCSDIVTCCDVIEHVNEPHKIVNEAYRILKPGGLFFFHTFNRNIISYLIVIKFVEWFVKNTPEHLHIMSMFVKPSELKAWCENAGFQQFHTIGIRPSIRSLIHKDSLHGIVPPSLYFKFTKNRLISYAGYAIKPQDIKTKSSPHVHFVNSY